MDTYQQYQRKWTKLHETMVLLQNISREIINAHIVNYVLFSNGILTLYILISWSCISFMSNFPSFA